MGAQRKTWLVVVDSLRQHGVSKPRGMGAPTTCLPVEPGLVGVRWMAGFVGTLSLPLDRMSQCSCSNLGQYCLCRVQRTPCLFCSRVSQREIQSTCDTVALVVYDECEFLDPSQFP